MGQVSWIEGAAAEAARISRRALPRARLRSRGAKVDSTHAQLRITRVRSLAFSQQVLSSIHAGAAEAAEIDESVRTSESVEETESRTRTNFKCLDKANMLGYVTRSRYGSARSPRAPLIVRDKSSAPVATSIGLRGLLTDVNSLSNFIRWSNIKEQLMIALYNSSIANSAFLESLSLSKSERRRASWSAMMFDSVRPTHASGPSTPSR